MEYKLNYTNFTKTSCQSDLNELNIQNNVLKESLVNRDSFLNFDDINDIILNAVDKDIIVHQNDYDEFKNVIKFYSTKYNSYYIVKTATSKDNSILNEVVVSLHSKGLLTKAHDAGFKQKIIYKNKEYIYDYVIYDYITGFVLSPFKYRQLIENGSLNTITFKKLINDIIYRLYLLNINIDFTHYDMHLYNIAIEEVNKTLYPHIIDYEMSHIKVHGMDIGIDAHTINVQNRSFWVADIIKLLMSFYDITFYLDNAMDDIQKINCENKLLIIKYLLYFFDEKDIIPYHTNVIYSEELNCNKFEDFIKYMNKN